MEVEVAANLAIVGVDARVGNHEWQPLSFTDWGSWAASFFVADESRVQFRARAGDSQEVLSGRFSWPDATPIEESGTGEDPFTATFSNARGNDWWVETDVASSEPLAGVEARVNRGDWIPLSPTDWGSWADSFFVAAGSTVEFRATSIGGASVISSPVTWPP